jgi:hypothetical protein
MQDRVKGDVSSHLASAVDALRQEAATIQIVGRALTDNEKARVALIDDACKALSDWMGRLSSGPAQVPRSAFPGDGRYELQNERFVAELRVDVKRMKVVSGDVFIRAGDRSRDHVFSFRSRPGVDVAPTDNPCQVIAEDLDGTITIGSLSIQTASDARTDISLVFESPLRSVGPSQALVLSGKRVGDSMRELGIELEYERGTDKDPSFVRGATVTIASSFRDVGIDVKSVGTGNEVPPPPSGFWKDGQLHALMASLAQQRLGLADWNLHLLMLSQHEEPRLLGVMFDAYSGDANRAPREGAAVFQTPIKQRPDWQRKLIQTTVHELGHALNLAHRFERAVGRADSTSFMNYDWKYLGGDKANEFWDRFQFTFDDDEREFLCHGPRHHVVPGAAEFRTIPYWRNMRGGYAPYLPEVPGSELVLRLIPPAAGALMEYGQPVLLELEVENASGQAMKIPDYLLDPKAGLLEIVVERVSPIVSPNGSAQRVFRPLFQRCYDLAAGDQDVVPPGGKLNRNINITFGAGGFTFVEPGNYIITAVLGVSQGSPPQYELVFRSDPLPLRVAYPKSDDDERNALAIFRPDIGYFLALGGSSALPKAAATLEDIRSSREQKKGRTDAVVAGIARAQAIHASRRYVRYRDRGFAMDEAKPEESERLFESARSAADTFDPVTAKQLRAK